MSGREAWSRKVVKAAEAARRVAIMSPILVYSRQRGCSVAVCDPYR
jgi:hypothetical protein